MTFEKVLESVEQYYHQKIETHGPTPRGVDWNSPASQRQRFAQLLKLCDPDQPFTINDYGCGYGAFASYLIEQGYAFQYRGYDISARMIEEAKNLHAGNASAQFFSNESLLSAADYTVASGIFNVRLDTNAREWQEYVLHTLDKIAGVSTKGFAFNVLTSYSDPEFMRSDLYYADPLFLFDHCKRHYSRFVSLLHDYPLYEFTILVRKG